MVVDKKVEEEVNKIALVVRVARVVGGRLEIVEVEVVVVCTCWVLGIGTCQMSRYQNTMVLVLELRWMGNSLIWKLRR